MLARTAVARAGTIASAFCDFAFKAACPLSAHLSSFRFAPYSVEKVALSGGLVIFFQSLRVARNFDSTRQRTRFHLINGG